jgi:hypothetical protein
MAAPLLTTKLYIPPPRSNLVPRPNLVLRLDEGLQLGHKLTLISAPAGFGKTTLLSEWIAGCPSRHRLAPQGSRGKGAAQPRNPTGFGLGQAGRAGSRWTKTTTTWPAS